jgi:hypothetical protein
MTYRFIKGRNPFLNVVLGLPYTVSPSKRKREREQFDSHGGAGNVMTNSLSLSSSMCNLTLPSMRNKGN